MEFFEYGDSAGIPVIFLLGTPQKGDAGADLGSHALKHGIRLICPTRPWYVDQEQAEHDFQKVTRPILNYLSAQDISRAYAIGGSGGGPFALHLTSHANDIFASCTLLASMGLPDEFMANVKSPPSKQLLGLFKKNQREEWTSSLIDWKVPRDRANGAWGDFSVLLGDWPDVTFETSCPIHIYHGKEDPNAPIESIEALAARLRNVCWHISHQADHIGMANDESGSIIDEIFGRISKEFHEVECVPLAR